MNNPLISVIVPIYKVEDYLNSCIASITKQTYTNLEIILVDDGSTDDTDRLLTDFRDSLPQANRIAIKQKNKSNLGIFTQVRLILFCIYNFIYF